MDVRARAWLSLLMNSLLVAGCTSPGDADVGGVADRPDALGATLGAGGTTFRVWAPNADRVFVTGTFNGWAEAVDALRRQDDGTFVGTIAAASEGDEYQYIIERAGARGRRTDPRARRVTNSAGNGIIVTDRFAWQTTNYQTPPWDDAVIYELHLGTFADAPGGGPGTWQSARARLPALAELGVSYVKVMPPAEFAGDFSWGYNTAFPFAPESAYGSPDDVKGFIDAAHALGIGVLIDVVYNHWGPSDLSMWCFDLACLGAGGIYFYTDWRLESGWGPRPDFGRQEVRDFIVDNTKMWLDEYRADGLRFDSTVNIRKASGQDLPDGWNLLARINNEVDSAQPWKLMIAEDLQTNAWLTKPTSDGGAGFDSQWDAEFVHPLHRAILAPSDAARNMDDVVRALSNNYGRAYHRVVYSESHDEVANGKQRLPSMIDPGQPDSWAAKKRSTLAAALVMTAPGIPMLFQGQEVLEDSYFTDTDPVDWTKGETFAGIWQLYRDLISLRRNRQGTTAGLRGEHLNVFHVNHADKVVAFHRWHQGGAGDDVIVLANISARTFAGYEVGLPRAGTWRVRLNSDWRGYDAGFGDTPSGDVNAQAGALQGLPFRGAVGLGPYSVVVLSQ